MLIVRIYSRSSGRWETTAALIPETEAQMTGTEAG
jgi:hypothetical protein